MLFALAFGALAASMSISDEIEGRTAVTLMSKPISRRQFLLGKFGGILLASLVMIVLLGMYFEGVILYKRWYESKSDPEPIPPPAWVLTMVDGMNLPGVVADFVRGILFWVNLTLETVPGLALNLSQIMVLVAIAVSLATRVPMVVNISLLLVVYFLAHLAPVLVNIGAGAQQANPGPVSQMLAFMAQLFDTILPGLDLFRVNVALVSDMPLASFEFFAYVGMVILYGVLYTAIVLLFGLILFEDRDLA
jgi:ABC-type transport system involved in multi-copper enzyme maturation permease subunit